MTVTGARVLFVEDEPVARRTIALFFRIAGHEVSEAETGEEALEFLSRMQFDAVITDLNLPGRLNGLDILNASKKTPRIKTAILITSFGSDETRSRAKSLGAGYMEKPIKLTELHSYIEHCAA